MNPFCPECKDIRVERDKQHGEMVCPKCGLITSDGEIDYNVNYRFK